MTQLTIQLPDELVEFVSHQATEGGFSSEGEFISSVLASLQARKRVEAQLLEGLDSDADDLTSEEWHDIRREARERAAGEQLNE